MITLNPIPKIFQYQNLGQNCQDLKYWSFRQLEAGKKRFLPYILLVQQLSGEGGVRCSELCVPEYQADLWDARKG